MSISLYVCFYCECLWISVCVNEKGVVLFEYVLVYSLYKSICSILIVICFCFWVFVLMSMYVFTFVLSCLWVKKLFYFVLSIDCICVNFLWYNVWIIMVSYLLYDCVCLCEWLFFLVFGFSFCLHFFCIYFSRFVIEFNAVDVL